MNALDWRVGFLKPKINVNIGLHARILSRFARSEFIFSQQPVTSLGIGQVEVISHPSNPFSIYQPNIPVEIIKKKAEI